MITAVSAYVPIPGHPRPEVEYQRLGRYLTEIGIPIMLVPEASLEDCWLFQYIAWRKLKVTHSVADNPTKNSIAYHIVQAQKSEWLADASVLAPDADVLVWIDFGIFSVPGLTGEVIKQFLIRARDEKVIAIPGCHEKGVFNYDDKWPNWRFCGGVLVMPRAYAVPFDQAMKAEYFRCIELTNNVSWEVNQLARVEQLHPELPIWWYQADHNASMFTNYRVTEDADGQKAATNQVSSRVLHL